MNNQPIIHATQIFSAKKFYGGIRKFLVTVYGLPEEAIGRYDRSTAKNFEVRITFHPAEKLRLPFPARLPECPEMAAVAINEADVRHIAQLFLPPNNFHDWKANTIRYRRKGTDWQTWPKDAVFVKIAPRRIER